MSGDVANQLPIVVVPLDFLVTGLVQATLAWWKVLKHFADPTEITMVAPV